MAEHRIHLPSIMLTPRGGAYLELDCGIDESHEHESQGQPRPPAAQWASVPELGAWVPKSGMQASCPLVRPGVD
jgi:hypothetical protein